MHSDAILANPRIAPVIYSVRRDMTMSGKFSDPSESALFMAYKEYAKIALQTIF